MESLINEHQVHPPKAETVHTCQVFVSILIELLTAPVEESINSSNARFPAWQYQRGDERLSCWKHQEMSQEISRISADHTVILAGSLLQY
jgi:hypothetical protein